MKMATKNTSLHYVSMVSLTAQGSLSNPRMEKHKDHPYVTEKDVDIEITTNKLHKQFHKEVEQTYDNLNANQPENEPVTKDKLRSLQTSYM